MYEATKIRNGNYISMKRLYDAYEVNNGKFGCNLTQMKLYKVSKLFDKWELKLSYTYSSIPQEKKFAYEVEMTYDFYWNRTYAILYYSR